MLIYAQPSSHFVLNHFVLIWHIYFYVCSTKIAFSCIWKMGDREQHELLNSERVKTVLGSLLKGLTGFTGHCQELYAQP